MLEFFLMEIGFGNVLMKRRSMMKLKQPMWMMWSMTFSCSIIVGAQVILVRSEGKWNLNQMTDLVMLLMVFCCLWSLH